MVTEKQSPGMLPKLVTMGGRFHYAWVIAITSSIVTLIGVEPLSLFGVFLEPISKDLGVGRGAVSVAYWLAFLSMGIASIASGWATDRLGVRKTLLISTLGTIVPLVMLAYTRQLSSLYFWYGIVYGICRAGITIPTLLTVTLWFKKKQGIAIGIASSGMAIGPMVFAPIVRHLIDSYGWGNAFFILGVISGVVLLPCCWLLRSRPSDIGLRPYGDTGEEAVMPVSKLAAPSHQPIYYRSDVPNFFKYAMKTQPFFLLPLIHFVGCISHSVPLAHVVVMATDRGIDPIAASTVLGVATGVSSLSRFISPVLADRIGGRKVLVIFILMQGISILWLLPARELWLFFVFSLFFGLALGGEMTPFPIINRQYYGIASIGTVYGFQVMIASLGMGIGGFLGGFLYDLMGDYTLAIWIAAAMGLAGAGLSYMLVDPFNPGKKLARILALRNGHSA